MSTTTQADAAKTTRPAVDEGGVDPVDEQLVRGLAERARAGTWRRSTVPGVPGDD